MRLFHLRGWLEIEISTESQYQLARREDRRRLHEVMDRLHESSLQLETGTITRVDLLTQEDVWASFSYPAPNLTGMPSCKHSDDENPHGTVGWLPYFGYYKNSETPRLAEGGQVWSYFWVPAVVAATDGTTLDEIVGTYEYHMASPKKKNNRAVKYKAEWSLETGEVARDCTTRHLWNRVSR